MSSAQDPRHTTSLCRLFERCSINTWRLMESGHIHSMPPSETTITDINLLNLRSHGGHQISVVKFSAQQEGRTTGADWEWWFGSANSWIGLRVQAKRLDIRSQRYRGLGQRNSLGLQNDILINDARSRQLTPIYAFYNYLQHPEPLVPWHLCCQGYRIKEVVRNDCWGACQSKG